MCIVIQCLTHDFTRLVNLIKSCNGACLMSSCARCLIVGRSARLQQAIKRPSSKAMDAKETWMLSILIFIVSLLGEHCNFDHLRREHLGMLRAAMRNVFVLTFLQILQLISTIFLR
jgi:cohesin loading factor subunit SCC2